MVWTEGREVKRQNDRNVYDVILPLLPKGEELTALTLPAGPAIWEKNIADLSPEHSWLVHGVECEEEYYPDLVETARTVTADHPNLKIELPFGCCDLKTKPLCFNRTKYDLMYLDFLGVWKPLYFEMIQNSFRNQLFKDNAVLVFTCAATGINGRNIHYEELKRFQDAYVDIPEIQSVTPLTGRVAERAAVTVKATTNTVMQLAYSHGYFAMPVHYGSYKNDGKPATFLTNTFHVTKR